MNNQSTADRPAVSAVICTRNRADKIGTAVTTVLANDHPDFTLTVIDQSTDDATRDVVEPIAASDPRVRYEHMDAAGLSRAYNRAIELTDADILAFTDDDCVVPVDWVSSVAAAFDAEPDGELLYGQVIPLEAGTDESGLTPYLHIDEPTRLSRSDGFHIVGMGANFAARRSLFERIGGFDEVLGGGGALKSSQDFDLLYRAYRAGAVIVLRPEVQIRHDGRREGEDWPTLLGNYGFGDGAFYTKHIRCRDPYAVWLVARQAGHNTIRQVRRVLRRKRPTGAYLGGLVRGARSSMEFDVDRTARMYIESDTADATDTHKETI